MCYRKLCDFGIPGLYPAVRCSEVGPNTGYREDINSFFQFLEANIRIDLELGKNYFKEYPL
jgi:hypothetical protein